MQIFIGIVLAAAIAQAAYRARTLTESGAWSAWVVGSLVFGVGGWSWAAALLAFFVTSSLLSLWRRQTKEAMCFEKGGRRDAGQVAANGGVAALCALGLLVGWLRPAQAHLLFLSALGAATADTWATEIGAVWGGAPRDLRTGRRVAAGTSGAVSAAGTLAGAAGALLLGVFAGPMWGIVAAAGFLGSIVDSVFGASLQAQWRDPQDPGRFVERPAVLHAPPARGWRCVGNDAVNALSSLAAAVFCALWTHFSHPS